MRLATFQAGGRVRAGVLVDDEIVDLGGVLGGEYATVTDILESGPEAMRAVAAAVADGRPRLPLSDVDLRAPVRPRKFFAIGLNYADHVAESGLEMPRNL